MPIDDHDEEVLEAFDHLTESEASTSSTAPSLEDELEEMGKNIMTDIIFSDSIDGFLEENRNKLVVIFTISSELLNQYAKEIFVQELMNPDYIHDEDVNPRTVANELNTRSRLDCLNHYGVITSELEQSVKGVHDYRNRLVHEPQKRHRITDLDQLSERIERSYSCVIEMREKVN